MKPRSPIRGQGTVRRTISPRRRTPPPEKGCSNQIIDDRTWDRLGALAGLGFIVLTLLATFLYPQQPRVDSAPATTLAWVHNHRSGIQTGMVFGLFGAALLLWFIGHLRRVM